LELEGGHEVNSWGQQQFGGGKEEEKMSAGVDRARQNVPQ
jgi:hypothetical protein